MKQIGFKNFRRFQDFPAIDLAPITIFVGENNAGKSTVVKALLALLDFLNSNAPESGINDASTAILNQQFYFNKSYFTHIGTFERALYNKAEEDKIVFEIAFKRYKFVIEVVGDREDPWAISGRISRLMLTMLNYNIDFDYDFRSDNIHITFHKEHPDMGKESVRGDSKTMNSQEKRITNKYFKSLNRDIELNMPISGIDAPFYGNNISGLLSIVFAKINGTIVHARSVKGQGLLPFVEQLIIEGVDDDTLQFLIANQSFFNQMRTLPSFSLRSDFSDATVEYIYAHAVTQTVIYSAKDINDYFVRTIHEYANQRVLQDTPIHNFIVKWMKVFKIGLDYEISSVGGEAHVVKINNSDGTSVNLADKGMGSIQLMILLFRLATKLAQSGVGMGGRLKEATIIVEEPEQNLHPMLQSKLADLFFELNNEYGFQFIIETHSEYLIRKTQVLVGEAYKKDAAFNNPFKVYYFPSEGTPYDLPYAKTGRFEEEFGRGFFDEASRWSREILRNENS